jgi:hypothetical protein
MSALQDALDMVKQVRENAQALADPAAVEWMAEIGFKQAVVDAINELSLHVTALVDPTARAPVADAAPSSTEPATIAPSNAGV